MALIGRIKMKPDSEDSHEEEVFEVEFTNGTLAQLKELAEFLRGQGLSIPTESDKQLEEVVKLGIAYLQRSKELSTSNHK